MIVTLTPNPSVDRTFEVTTLERGEVVRALRHQLDPGGKGINVARALHANGHSATAVVPVGGLEGDQLLHLLAGTGLAVVTVPISGSVRSNVTIVEPDGTVTKLNEPGPLLSAAELDALVDAATAASRGARWLVASGSLPPSAPEELFARVVSRAREAGAAVAVDTSGPALAAALPAGPDLVKPNADELAELSGRDLATIGEVVDAARDLLDGGARIVLASLGVDGAVLVTRHLEAHASAHVATPNSSVGAGDATVAGFLSRATVDGRVAPDGHAARDGHPAADSDDLIAALRAAVAYGAAAVSLPGSEMPGPDDLRLDQVLVETPPERDRPLVAPTAADRDAMPSAP